MERKELDFVSRERAQVSGSRDSFSYSGGGALSGKGDPSPPKLKKSLIPYPDSQEGSNAFMQAFPSVRPRAPISSSLTGLNENADGIGELGIARRPGRSRARGVRRGSRKQKSQSIAELWDSLQHFSRNNLGRSLEEQEVSSNIAAPSESIHFVNIDDWEEDFSMERNNRVFSNKKEPLVSLLGSVEFIQSTAFTIPELPRGKSLVLNLLSTWGDPHYIGLMGIEIFDKSGHLVTLSNVDQQIWANPADINVLPEYGK